QREIGQNDDDQAKGQWLGRLAEAQLAEYRGESLDRRRATDRGREWADQCDTDLDGGQERLGRLLEPHCQCGAGRLERREPADARGDEGDLRGGEEAVEG